MLKIHIYLTAVTLVALDKAMSLQMMVKLASVTSKISIYKHIQHDLIIKCIHGTLKKPKNMKRRKCLRLGLLNYHFLRLAGRNPQIHFSVAPPKAGSKRLHSHCWVSLPDGTTIDPPLPEMKELWCFPPDNNKS